MSGFPISPQIRGTVAVAEILNFRHPAQENVQRLRLIIALTVASAISMPTDDASRVPRGGWRRLPMVCARGRQQTFRHRLFDNQETAREQ